MYLAQGLVGIKQGLEAARVEENFQIEGWGLVEGGHDIDSAGVKVQVAAPSVFLRLLRSDPTTSVQHAAAELQHARADRA